MKADEAKMNKSIEYIFYFFFFVQHFFTVHSENKPKFTFLHAYSAKGSVHSIVELEDGHLLIGQEMGLIEIFDPNHRNRSYDSIVLSDPSTTSIAIYKNNFLYAASRTNNDIRVRDITTNVDVVNWTLPNSVQILKIYKNKLFVGSVGFYIYDLKSTNEFRLAHRTSILPNYWICAIAANEDIIVFSEYSGKIKVIDANDYSTINIFDVGIPWTCPKHIILKDNYIFSSDDNKINMWNLLDGKKRRILSNNEADITSLIANSKFLVSGNKHGSIKIWDFNDLLDVDNKNEVLPYAEVTYEATRVIVYHICEENQIQSVYDGNEVVLLNEVEADPYLENDLEEIRESIRTFAEMINETNAKMENFMEEINKKIEIIDLKFNLINATFS